MTFAIAYVRLNVLQAALRNMRLEIGLAALGIFYALVFHTARLPVSYVVCAVAVHIIPVSPAGRILGIVAPSFPSPQLAAADGEFKKNFRLKTSEVRKHAQSPSIDTFYVTFH